MNKLYEKVLRMMSLEPFFNGYDTENQLDILE